MKLHERYEGENKQKAVDQIILRAHIDLGIIAVSASWSGETL